MNFLDIRTVMFSQLITDAACTGVLTILWLQNRKRHADMFYWVVDFIFQTTAALLIVLRGTIPDWISVGIASPLVIGGALVGYLGLQQFVGERRPQVHNFILLGIFVLIHFFFVLFQSNLAARNLILSLGLLVFCSQCAWLLLRRTTRGLTRMTQAVGWVFALICLVSLARIVIILVIPNPSNDFFRSGLYDTLLLMGYQILLIVLTFGLALMVNRQLLAVVETQEDKFTKVFQSSPYAILITRFSDGLVLDVNRTFEEISGYLPSEVIGKTSLDLGLWANETDRQLVIEELFARGEVQGREFQFLMKSGLERTGLYYAEIIVIDNERLILSSLSDITDRKKAEEQIRLLASIVEAANDAIIGKTLEGIILSWNPGAEKLYGYSSLEAIGKSISMIAPPEKLDEVGELLERVTRGERVESYETVRVAKDGRHLNISLTISPITDGTGKIAGASAIGRDITERVRAKGALEESEGRFRSIFENVSIGLYRTTPEGRILLANPALISMLGYETFEDLAGRDLEKAGFEPQYTRAGFRQEVESKEGVKGLEAAWKKKDGTTIFVRESARAFRNDYGKVLYYEGTVEDITERRRAEQALEESESIFRGFLEQSEDALMLTDNHGLLIQWSNGAEKLTGFSREESLGHPIWDVQFRSAPDEFKSSENYETIKTALQATLRTGKGRLLGNLIEAAIQKPDGTRLITQTLAFPVQTDKGVLLGTILRDITERKKAEEALARQAEELRLRNEELDRLYRASGSLLSSTVFDVHTLVKVIVEVVLREFGQANCSVFLVQEESNELKLMAMAGLAADQMTKKTLTLDGPGLIAQAIRSGQTINTPDVSASPIFLRSWEATHSELTIPLKVADHVIGAIDIESEKLNAFSADDVRVMSLFAERAALELEHARLFAQTERRMQNLLSLRMIDLAISSSFDLKLTLDILLGQLVKRLGVHAADVLVLTPATQAFQFIAGQGFRTQALQHTHLHLGDGYAGQAARKRHTITIQNLETNLNGLERSRELAAEGFVTYSGTPLIAKGEVKGVLEIFHREPLDLDREEFAVLEMLAGQAAIAIDNSQLFEHLENLNSELMMAYDETIEGWSRAMDLRDKETEGHTQRVTELTIRLANSMGFKSEELAHVRRGALLHDIGKIGVPDDILRKPGPLTDEEWVIMRKHPQFAYDMLAPIIYLRPSIEIPYLHHEKWDGTGYPRGLRGEEIPLVARIFALVDVWDALCSDRPYRKAWPEEKVRSYIQEQAGKHFDPHLVEIFLKEVSQVQ